MITPSYGLTATERVLPRMALDFTTALLDSRVTFTRSGNTATVTNSSGVIVGINANLPRFDFNPTTLICRGLLIEEARTNDLLNSLIDGTSLATQLVTVIAAARTFSFYGTGTVVLSGAHSATVVGTGAYPTRTTLTFTPSAGVLTLTVTGTVQFAQLETGAFATSFIPTAATAVTRNADVASMTGTNFSSWFNADEGSFVVDSSTSATGLRGVLGLGEFANDHYLAYSGSDAIYSITTNNIAQTFLTRSKTDKLASAYKTNVARLASGGSAVATDATVTLPTVSLLRIGNFWGVPQYYLNGHIKTINYYPQALIVNEVQAFSK